MKKWNTPEMNLFSVRMNENIAASGDAGGDGYEQRYVVCFRSDAAGGIVEMDGTFNCKGTVIADTSVSYLMTGNQPYVYRASWSEISGCQVG